MRAFRSRPRRRHEEHFEMPTTVPQSPMARALDDHFARLARTAEQESPSLDHMNVHCHDNVGGLRVVCLSLTHSLTHSLIHSLTHSLALRRPRTTTGWTASASTRISALHALPSRAGVRSLVCSWISTSGCPASASRCPLAATPSAQSLVSASAQILASSSRACHVCLCVRACVCACACACACVRVRVRVRTEVYVCLVYFPLVSLDASMPDPLVAGFCDPSSR
jgi:hypothetical protein